MGRSRSRSRSGGRRRRSEDRYYRGRRDRDRDWDRDRRERERRDRRDVGSRSKMFAVMDPLEEKLEGIASVFDLVVFMEEISPVLMAHSNRTTETDVLDRSMKHTLFCAVIAKATSFFCPDIMLDVLAFIDKYYLHIHQKTLDKEVVQYLDNT
eukprot:Sspe_Gene.74987::Locus_46859_Transcript_1_1_Confidence_1.000_Length_542::g.74987::m.74987